VADAPLLAKVLTVSDGVVHGTRQDRSGAALVERLAGASFVVVEHRVVADGVASVADALTAMSDSFAGVIVSTGGTGFTPRDLTPEGTRQVIEREAPGLAEAMRRVNPLGRLSRRVLSTQASAGRLAALAQMSAVQNAGWFQPPTTTTSGASLARRRSTPRLSASHVPARTRSWPGSTS